MKEQIGLKVINSLSGEKEKFEPLKPPHVGMYVCGPTVYSNVHLGNLRTFLSFDLINRYLRHLGFKVRYVRNITDVGHLTDDSDDGEDKISKKARLEQLEPMEIVHTYTRDFHEVLDQFNLLPPNIEPTATGHIVEQIKITKILLEKGLAYESKGSIYFDVLKYNETENYGELSKRKIEDLLTNTRNLDGQSDKKNPPDFALWKKAMPEHIMRWDSPWGEGFPGWHIECTVMSTKYLGKQFDIHGGGYDLKFPHHECEIAQARGAYGKAPVKYWLHGNMLLLNGQKMSKSTGNSILPGELISGENGMFSKAYSPMAVRFFMLQAHYRSVLDLTENALQTADRGYNRLMRAIDKLEGLEASSESTFSVEDWKKSSYAAMDDDFNSPMLIAQLFEAVGYINQINDGKQSLTQEDLDEFKNLIEGFAFDVLGLRKESQNSHSSNTKLEGTIKLLIQLRNEARANKNFQLSDQIRDELNGLGVQLMDGSEGTQFQIEN